MFWSGILGFVYIFGKSAPNILINVALDLRKIIGMVYLEGKKKSLYRFDNKITNYYEWLTNVPELRWGISS